MRAQSSAATAAASCAACSLARGAGAKILRRIAFAGIAALRLALRRTLQWRNANLRMRQMRRCKPRIRLPLRRRKPRLQPRGNDNLRQRLYLRQRLRRRMRARRLGKRKQRRRKTKCAACSFARCAGAKTLHRIGFAGTAALLGALSRPLRMRQYLRGRKPRP